MSIKQGQTVHRAAIDREQTDKRGRQIVVISKDEKTTLNV